MRAAQFRGRSSVRRRPERGLSMHGPVLPLATYRRRRRQVFRDIARACESEIPLLVCAAPLQHPLQGMTPEVGRPRQAPWFEWLTGCAARDALLLIDAPTSSCLFLEPGDPQRVAWEGPRLQPNRQTQRDFGLQAVADRSTVKAALRRALDRSAGRLAFLGQPGQRGWQEDCVRRLCRGLRGMQFFACEQQVVARRLFKDADEIALMRRAIAQTWQGLRATLAQVPKLRHEAEVAGMLVGHYLSAGYDPLAFSPIVASGQHATTLHYTANAGALEPGRPLLIDSGASYGGYCADITRTVPQHGRFDDPRFRELYQLVLKANRLARRSARPGMSLRELSQIAWQPILQAGFQRWHGLSHSIGIEVHDPGSSPDLILRPGMVISNEPGIYLPEEGLGIRIEDDLLITADGCEELSAAIPKSIPALERLMASGD